MASISWPTSTAGSSAWPPAPAMSGVGRRKRSASYEHFEHGPAVCRSPGTAVFYRDRSPTPSPPGAPRCASINCRRSIARKGAARGFEDVVEHRAGAVLRVGGLGAHRGSGRWAMSAGTESLIRAIQTNDPLAFYGWLHTLKGTPDGRWRGRRSRITALGVASVMYAKAIQSDRIPAARYAAMIEALMDAGANPLVRIGSGSWCDGAHREARTSSDLRSSERRRGLWRRSVPGNAGMVRTPYRGFDEHPPSPLPPSVHQDSATGR